MSKNESKEIPLSEKKEVTCFVISPIGAEDSKERLHADWLFEGIITKATHDLGKKIILERADKIEASGQITKQIIRRLHDSDIVIADGTFANPNVYYEIGIRHQTEKPIIHMVLKGENLPFDVSGNRTHFFSYGSPQEMNSAAENLKLTITHAIENDSGTDTPVSDVLLEKKSLENASDLEKRLVNLVEQNQSEIHQLRRDIIRLTNSNYHLPNSLEQKHSELSFQDKLALINEKHPSALSKLSTASLAAANLADRSGYSDRSGYYRAVSDAMDSYFKQNEE